MRTKAISDKYDLSLIERLDVVRRHPKIKMSRNKAMSEATLQWVARKEQEYLMYQFSDTPKPLGERISFMTKEDLLMDKQNDQTL